MLQLEPRSSAGAQDSAGRQSQIARADPLGPGHEAGTAAAEPPPTVATATAPPVDPRLIGTWTLVGAPGVTWNWEIRGDGSYVLRDGPRLVHQGTVTFAGGTWTLQSPTWQDAGRYTLDGDHLATIVGSLGPGTWARTTR